MPKEKNPLPHCLECDQPRFVESYWNRTVRFKRCYPHHKAHISRLSKEQGARRLGAERPERYIMTGGYVRLLVGGQYVPEHVYIMEQKLGRKLVKGESVHHLNGVRDDNRPENLELWMRRQPSGQRDSDVRCLHCGNHPFRQLPA